MKLLKWLLVLLAIYAGVVTVFESLLGYYQPSNEGTLRLTTTDADGTAHPRVLARVTVDDTLYVAVNHWPRGWYHRALENPDVTVEIDGTTGRYRAVEVEDGEEYTRVNNARPLGLGFRILTGFPPRRLIRLDPAGA